MTPISEHCRQAWLHCEQLLAHLRSRPHAFSHRTQQVLQDCAGICLGTMEALRRRASSMQQFVVLCMGICVECAELCTRYPDAGFRSCADACGECAEALTLIADV